MTTARSKVAILLLVVSLSSLASVVVQMSWTRRSIRRSTTGTISASEPTTSAPSSQQSSFFEWMATSLNFLFFVSGDTDRRPTENPSVMRGLHNLTPLSDNHINQNQPIPNNQTKQPPYKLLITDFRWNNADTAMGRNFSRTIRTAQLLQGVMHHPYYDPTGWQDYTSGRRPIDPTVRYYVFLDVETCYESNYPNYGAPMEQNLDRTFNRIASKDHFAWDCYFIESCIYVSKVLQSPLFQQSQQHFNRTITSRLVYFDCLGLSIPARFRRQHPTPQLALTSISAETKQHNPIIDQGLPPPAVTKIELSPKQIQDITDCSQELVSRPYWFTFVGGIRKQQRIRVKLIKLHNPSQGVIALHRDNFPSHYPNMTYTQMLQQSIFAATPRGDNLFSYRFTEVLSSGAIPVLHSDQWVLPFRQELVNWTECVIRIPERRVNQTLQILQSYTQQQRCQMRQKCYEIYTKYMATPQGTIRGLIDGLELVRQSSN